MPASTIAVFNDPRTFEAAVQGGCSLELLVTGKGQFRAEVIGIMLPRLRLLRPIAGQGTAVANRHSLSCSQVPARHSADRAGTSADVWRSQAGVQGDYHCDRG